MINIHHFNLSKELMRSVLLLLTYLDEKIECQKLVVEQRYQSRRKTGL